MMRQLDSQFAANEETYMRPLDYMPPDREKLPPDFELPAPVPAELIAHVEEALAGLPPEEIKTGSRVDWSYLDKLERGDVALSDFPAWAQYLLLEIDDLDHLAWLKQFFLQRFSNPPVDQGWEDEEDRGD
jgi:hypothetical protein